MEQRVSLITLGVDDLAVSKAFYEALGWTGQEVTSPANQQAQQVAPDRHPRPSLPVQRNRLRPMGAWEDCRLGQRPVVTCAYTRPCLAISAGNEEGPPEVAPLLLFLAARTGFEPVSPP